MEFSMSGHGAIMDAVRLVLWYALVAAGAGLALHYRRARSGSWRLFGLIYACIIVQAAYMTMWAVHNGVARAVGIGRLTDTLYRLTIPLDEARIASFMGLLLLLAAGYCITRTNMGAYRNQVIGLPILLFVTGVVTKYIEFQVLEASTDRVDLLARSGWEQGLWFVCAFLNLAAFGWWVVYMFEIIQVEADALKAQQELNLVRQAAPSATVAPFPGSFSRREQAAQQPANGQLPSQAHAAPPPGLDPEWTAAAAEEGVVAYKNLLGPGQNMSHIPGADAEAQEITTVADMVNFEVKSRMYRRFSAGFGVFMIAQLCVILAPVFVLDIVQDVITMLQFAVVFGFLAVLLWLFRPADDSPYLLMGEGLDTLDTALGVDEAEAEDHAAGFGSAAAASSSAAGARAPAAANGYHQQRPAGGVELSGLQAKRPSSSGGGAAGPRLNGVGTAAAADREGGRDQAHAGGSAGTAAALPPRPLLSPPSSLPAIKTSVGQQQPAGARGAAGAPPQQQQQLQQLQQAGGGAAAAAGSLGGAGPQFSLEDEEELHEIKLDSSSLSPPPKRD